MTDQTDRIKRAEPRFVYDEKRDCVFISGIPGFYDTDAYRTGDESSDSWELDLSSHEGLDGHIVFPYTVSMDLFESRLHKEVDRLWNVSLLLQKYRANR